MDKTSDFHPEEIQMRLVHVKVIRGRVDYDYWVTKGTHEPMFQDEKKIKKEVEDLPPGKYLVEWKRTDGIKTVARKIMPFMHHEKSRMRG